MDCPQDMMFPHKVNLVHPWVRQVLHSVQWDTLDPLVLLLAYPNLDLIQIHNLQPWHNPHPLHHQ